LQANRQLVLPFGIVKRLADGVLADEKHHFHSIQRHRTVRANKSRRTGLQIAHTFTSDRPTPDLNAN
jgi:hypothetical protein